MAVTVIAAMAAGAHVMSFSGAALADQKAFDTATERQVIPHPPTAASDGLPVPALVGGIVLAFAVGIVGGQVHRRRRAVHRRSVASARPAPAVTPPARPAPEPPATPTEPRTVEVAPAAPVAPAPPPPEPEPPAEQPVDLTGPPLPVPAPPPPEPPRREVPPARPREPLRLLSRPAPRPPVDAPLGEAPEVPRLERPSPAAVEPAIPLESAPETVLTPVAATPEPEAEPARRFARPAPWPEEAHELWTCEIAWKAGYRKSSFRALAGPPGAGKRRPMGDSPSVRWTLMGEPEPPTPELAIRVRALVQALEAAGWEHIGRGQVWYAQRFVWRGAGEPQPVDVADVEPAER